MNIEQFEQSIKQLFNAELLEEFHDDYGFTNKLNEEITTVGYCTNISLEVIEQAKDENVDLLITHHDAWDFIYGLREECLKKLVDYNISHFWIHGPLDYVDFGTSTSLMNILGVNKVIRHSMYKEGDIPGIGEFNNPIEFNALVERMAMELNEPVRSWKNNNKLVNRVGVLTGAGHATDNLKYALEDGCDTYITGEATLYTIQYAQFAGINLLVGSHTFTEIYGVESLVKRIKDLNNDIMTIRLKEDHFELNHS